MRCDVLANPRRTALRILKEPFMGNREPIRRTFPWLELALFLAITVVFCVLFPTVTARLLSALNPGYWPAPFWLTINLVVVGVLFCVRFGPELLVTWQKYQQKKRAQRNMLADAADRARQREIIEGIKRGRTHRLY